MITISPIFGLAIYGIIWFLTLFMVLPIGVRTQEEAGLVEPGSEASAPVLPHMWKRLLATTFFACLIFAGVYWLLTSPSAVPFWEALSPSFSK